jgi:hypothetical protein
VHNRWSVGEISRNLGQMLQTVVRLDVNGHVYGAPDWT